MTFEEFLTHASADSTLDELKKALAAGTCCAWRLRGTQLEYAVRDAFDPAFTLLATDRNAELAAISMSYTQAEMSEGAKGIKMQKEQFDKRRKRVLKEGVKAAPDAKGKVVKISLDRHPLRGALAGLFTAPAASSPVVDLRLEKSTEKPDGAKDYSPEAAGTRTLPRLYMAAVYTVLGNHKKIPVGSQPDREGVVAIIADRRGNIVSWGLKNQDVDCWHGETISVIRLGGRLPEGAVVFSSLKPCYMCAGALHAASDGKVKVYWGMNDPGVDQATALDREHLGTTLDGNKSATFEAKALMSKPHDESATKRAPLSAILQAALPERASAVNWSAAEGGDAEKQFGKVQEDLAAKTRRYAEAQQARKPHNPNTAKVLEYLNGFLKAQAKVIG